MIKLLRVSCLSNISRLKEGVQSYAPEALTILDENYTAGLNLITELITSDKMLKVSCPRLIRTDMIKSTFK